MNRYKILNTYVDQISTNELNKEIVNSVQKSEKKIIGNLNINAANLCFENKVMENFNNASSIIFCDGAGIQLACKFLGYYPIPEKITYNTWIPNLLKFIENKNIRVFILGSTKEVNKIAIKKIKNIHPKIKIEGHHGYFDKEGDENNRIIANINDFKANILIVGFGMPLQEEWILNNFDKINANIFLNGGACLDWYTGKFNQCPQFISDIGLEWLWRLFLEPKRLFKRYLIGNFAFYYRLLLNKIS